MGGEDEAEGWVQAGGAGERCEVGCAGGGGAEVVTGRE